MFVFQYLHDHARSLPNWGVALLLIISVAGVAYLLCFLVKFFIEEHREGRK